jgi:hypothetical protein
LTSDVTAVNCELRLSAELLAARFIPAPALARAVTSDAGLLPHPQGAVHHESCVLVLSREISQADRSVASSSTMVWCGVVWCGVVRDWLCQEFVRAHPNPGTSRSVLGHAQMGGTRGSRVRGGPEMFFAGHDLTMSSGIAFPSGRRRNGFDGKPFA